MCIYIYIYRFVTLKKLSYTLACNLRLKIHNQTISGNFFPFPFSEQQK